MNSLNALGFLALGSVMNALPALAPTMIDRGVVVADLSPGALWLHFMGLVVGVIGGSTLLRQALSHTAAARSAAPALRPTPVPQRTALPAGSLSGRIPARA